MTTPPAPPTAQPNSPIDDGGPAFSGMRVEVSMEEVKHPMIPPPGGVQEVRRHVPVPGMSLRDYFAAKAMQAIVSATCVTDIANADKPWKQQGISVERWQATAAYVVADAMLAARKAVQS